MGEFAAYPGWRWRRDGDTIIHEEMTKRQTFELGYANLLLQEMTAKAIARFRYSWENVAVRLVVRQRLAAQGFMPSRPRVIGQSMDITLDFREMGRALAHATANMN